MCQNDPNCKCGLISDFHALRDQEILLGKRHIKCVEDDENTQNARALYNENPSDINAIMALANALAFQMRYNEALEYYEMAREIEPCNYQVRRRCAGRYFSTLRLEDAQKEYEWCIANADDKLDPLYMWGCVKYCQGCFEEALKAFDECLALAEGDGDMYIGVLYWAIACCVRTSKSIDKYLTVFSPNIQIGHHTGYLQTVKLFAGEPLESCDNIPDSDELQKCIFMYGVHLYFSYKNNAILSDMFLVNTLKLDKYFSAFAYLAAYCEFIGKN